MLICILDFAKVDDRLLFSSFFLSQMLILTAVIEVNIGRWRVYGRRLMFCLRWPLALSLFL